MNERSNNLGREEIIIEKEFVRRPKVPWSKDVQRFLRFLHDQQINYVPKPLGFDQEEHELVSFVPGRYMISHCRMSFIQMRFFV